MISYDNIGHNTKIVVKFNDGTIKVYDSKRFASSFLKPVNLMHCLNDISAEEGKRLANISIKNAVYVEEKFFS